MKGIQKLAFVALVLCGCFAATNATLTFHWINGSSDPGWFAGRQNSQIIVLQVRADSPASALQFGDKVLLLGGQQVGQDFSVHRAFENVPAGTPYSMTVERNGRRFDYNFHTQPFSVLARVTSLIAVGLVPLLFLFFAFLLILFSQGDRRALLLAYAFALTIPEIPLFSLASAPGWVALIMMIGRPLTYLAFPLYLHFSLIYPEESPLVRRYPWLRRKKYLYAPYVVFGLVLPALLMWHAYFNPAAAFYLRNSLLGFLARFGTILVYLPVAFYAIHLSYKQAGEVNREKLSLIRLGLFIGFIPTVTRSFLLFVLRQMPNGVQAWFTPELLDWFVFVAFALLALLPIFLITAITTHELVPLREPAKRAAKFVLIRGAFILACLITLAGFFYFVLRQAAEVFRPGNFGWQVFLLGIAVVLPVVFIRFTEWLERNHVNVYIKSRSINLTDDLDEGLTGFRTALMVFLRKAQRRLSAGAQPQNESDLGALCDDVARTLRDAAYPREFALTLARRISEIFTTDHVAVFVEDTSKGCYDLAAYVKDCNGVPASPPESMALPSDSVVVDFLKRQKRALPSPVEWLEKEKELHAPAAGKANRRALRVLKRVNATRLLPAKHDDQLPLIIAVGRSYEFSWREKRAMNRLSRVAAVESEFASWKRVIGSPELKVALENLLVAAVRSIRPAQRGSIYLWDDKQQKLVIRAQYRFMPDIVRAIKLDRGEGFAGKAFESNEKLIIDDFQKDDRGANVGLYHIGEIKSAMFIPLQAWGRTIGILCIDNVESKGQFQKKHITRVERFGSMVSLAVQNARVQTELRKLGSKLDKGDTGCEDILSLVFESVASFTEVKAANILLVMDPRESTAVHEQKPLRSLAKGFDDDVAFCESFTPRADGMTNDALKSLKEFKGGGSEPPREIKYGKPEHPPIKNKAGLDYGIEASICFPFQVSEFVAGMLFFNYFSPHIFQDSEVEALRLFANEAALGIANALKREELQYIDQVVWMALLISGLQHDMNQSTDVIDNDLLILDGAISESPTEHTELALRAVSRIRNSVIEIQSHQKRMINAWTSDFTKVNLYQVVTKVATRGCRANPKISLDLSDFQEGQECWVNAIPLQLHLVVKNLVSNAVRATLKCPNPSLTISRTVRGRRVELAITNTGEPIPAEIRSRIFKEVILNSELQRMGHGMGLWIGRRIIRRHGGDLDLVRSDDSGTTFTLWLPLVNEKDAGARPLHEEMYEQI